MFPKLASRGRRSGLREGLPRTEPDRCITTTILAFVIPALAMIACADAGRDQSFESDLGFEWVIPPSEATDLIRYSCAAIGQYEVITEATDESVEGAERTVFSLQLRDAWLTGSADLIEWSIPCGQFGSRDMPCSKRLMSGAQYVIFWRQIDPTIDQHGYRSGQLFAAFQELDGAVRESLGSATRYLSLAEFRIAVEEGLRDAQISSTDDCREEPLPYRD